MFDAVVVDALVALPDALELAVVTFDGTLSFSGEPGEVVIFIDLDIFA